MVILYPMFPKFRNRIAFWKVPSPQFSSSWWEQHRAEDDYGVSVEC